jgi:catechol 2,3-dioxygenase-like lactoylglutathione lyase family enzyme
MPIIIDRLDHLVLTVKDIQATREFYVDILGMEMRSFGNKRFALHFGNQKFNLHEANNPIDPNVRHATPGSADLCLITETPIAEVISILESKQIPIIAGPGERTGAIGVLHSIYVYDPDDNLIEIANYI